MLTQLAEAKPKLVTKTNKVPQILQVLMNLIAEYKGSAANALFNYQALDDDDDEEDEDYDGSVVSLLSRVACSYGGIVARFPVWVFGVIYGFGVVAVFVGAR